ncbi:hypothetical protein [Chromobacterium phragmitis]|uniref:hypothetical protein n=1 Tax=Chromobacterium phragmitis TaxID=2202141 RepID=UPI0011AE2364|nr:hypothetical protein [Chromobacterium phragmitis]
MLAKQLHFYFQRLQPLLQLPQGHRPGGVLAGRGAVFSCGAAGFSQSQADHAAKHGQAQTQRKTVYGDAQQES